MTRDAYVGFGSNLGDPARTLRLALARVATLGQIEAVSPVYRTAPVGGVAQPDFLNAVALLRTALPAESLLRRLLAIELEFGRERRVRFGPRTLDLDLLWYGGVERSDDLLTLPHPRAHEREFVLRPLCDIAPWLELHGGTAAGLLAALAPQGVADAGLPPLGPIPVEGSAAEA